MAMDKLREEFEVLYMKHNQESSVAFSHPVGRYKYAYTQAQYEFFLDAWKASRASIVVELPGTDNYWNGTSGHEIFNHRQFAADSCDALRDIGLSIKGE